MVTLFLASVTSWPDAFLGVSIVAAFCWLLVSFVKNMGTTSSSSTTLADLPSAQPMYKQTKVTIDREELKELLREMGVVDQAEARLAKIEAILYRDYSALMKRMDKKNDPPPQPPTEGGLS